MFLFRCCMRVDCGCQNESEAEASRSSHSACDYLQQSEKQIQCRLLPQPVDTSCAKHFADYSGCSHTTASRSLLVSSTQSIDYEEVLCVSVPSSREDNEPHYACVNDNVICKPPCSVGIINNNFSPDASSYNNNVLQPQSSDSVKFVSDTGSHNGNGSSESSDVSSAGSSIDEQTSSEVKYVADIRQFQSAQTSVRPHGEDCCCPACQSVTDVDVDGAENSELIRHHRSDLKCSCKSCREFHSRMYVANRGPTVGVNAYRLISSIAQDVEHIPITWSQSSPKLTAVSRIAEHAKLDSGKAQSTHKSASVSADRSDLVLGSFRSDEADDDNGLFSSDDELHYVFHKFIDDAACLEKPFTGVSADGRLRPDAAAGRVVQSEPGAELEHTSSRSADDLEVAFFMVGSISPGSPSTVFPDGSYVMPTAPASVAISTECETAASEDSVTSVTDHAAGSCTFVTEPSAYSVQESLSAVVSDSEPYSLNVVCKDMEADNGFETSASNAGSASPCELVSSSDALRIEARELETDFYVGSNLNILDNENQQSYSQPGSSDVQRNVIVRRLSDSSSLFIELPAADSERVLTENVSVPVASRTNGTCTVEEFAPAVDNVVIEQSFEVVTPQCITEHPVSADEVVLLQTVDDAYYGHDQKHTATDVAFYVHGIVAEAAQQIADNSASASVRICNVASEAEDTSSELPKQILITSAPLPSTCHQLVTEDEYDRQVDNILSTAADDLEPHLASVDREYVNAGIVDIGVLNTGTGVDISWSKEAIYVTGIEIQEVAPVENYLISYDAHLLQQPVDDDADRDVDRALIWSSDSSCPDKSVAYGDVRLQDLVQPLEHVVSESEGDVAAATELNLDLDDLQTGQQDADQAASALGAAPIDIVEDFFMQYVLPVDSVGYNIEKDAAVHRDDAGDQAKVDRDEDLVQARKLEITAEKIVDVVIGDAVAETQVDVATVSAELGVQCEEVVDKGEVDWDLEGMVEGTELEAVAEAVVDVVINDATVDLTTGPTSSLTAAGDDAQLLVPSRSGCLLQSPSEPHRKKSVHFADTHGLQLETVQRYNQTPGPEESLASLEEFLSKLSAAAAERRAKWT